MAGEGTYSLADIGALMNNRHDGFDDNWIWILFLLIFGGGYGYGNNGALTRAEMTDGFNNQSVLRKLDGITQGLCDGFYSQNTTMLQGFNTLGSQISSCCCETNRNIDAVRYENAKNTCDIVRAIEKDGDATRALINANTMQALRDKLAEQSQAIQSRDFQLSQLAQNETLISRLQPTPKPAYLTCSPYQAQMFPFGNYGCGSCGY